MADCFDLICELENRLRRAVLEMPRRKPWVEAERDEIRQIIRQCLGIREAWQPSVHAQVALKEARGGVVVQMLRATTWDRSYACAHLFLPADSARNKLPFVLLCCGHGKGGKRALGYQQLAWRLAHMGCAVLVPDNIGQGERTPMGHQNVLRPFQCGTSLQGMIVMEAGAWIRWAQADGRFDRSHFFAVGNSGGGTLTMFLCALHGNDLVAVSSSAYPSTFEFVALKEKKHCHCNLLPGVIGQLDMWHLYGCFAPRPLFLFQGNLDLLFPEDLFDTVSRKTLEVYARCGASGAFHSHVFKGEHPWDDARREALAEFVGKIAGLDPARRPDAPLAEPFAPCYDAWPTDALDADQLAEQITGVHVNPVDALYQIYAPELERIPDEQYRRVGFRQLAAQYQAFIAPALRRPLEI